MVIAPQFLRGGGVTPRAVLGLVRAVQAELGVQPADR